jgi:hypothetical protein
MTDEEEKSTAIYKPERCYRCGGQMGVFTLRDTWKMRIDGVMHDVPVFAIPCKKCLQCDTCVLDGTSDEPMLWCLNRYLDANGLNTRWHKLRRWIRRRLLCYRDRWSYWVFKTFYKKDERNAA